jgi:hypothetical protein
VRAEKNALDRKLVDFNGNLTFYALLLSLLGAFQFIALCAQAIVLGRAFKEANRTAGIARDAMVAGGRAFVFALDVRAFWELDDATGRYSWRFRPVLKNAGDTPTKGMLMHTQCVVITQPLQRGFDFDYRTSDLGDGLIAPKADALGSLAPRGPALSPQDIIDTQQGRRFIYLWGWVRYSDVFPGTPRHVTRFCWAMHPVGNPLAFNPATNPQGMRWDTVHHIEGNSTGDD